MHLYIFRALAPASGRRGETRGSLSNWRKRLSSCLTLTTVLPHCPPPRPSPHPAPAPDSRRYNRGSLQCGQRGADQIIDERRGKGWAGAQRGKAGLMQSFFQRIWEAIIYLKYSRQVDATAQSFATGCLAFCFSLICIYEYIIRTRNNYGASPQTQHWGQTCCKSKFVFIFK